MPTQMIKSQTQLNYPGLVGQDEGLVIGTGTILNIRGANAILTVSGTVIDVFVTGSTTGGGTADFPFGDGSLGDVTINGIVTLDAPQMYRNLTIPSGTILRPQHFVVYVSDTLLINPYGKIEFNGLDGENGTGTLSGNGGNGAATPLSILNPFWNLHSEGAIGGGTTASGTANGLGGGAGGTGSAPFAYPLYMTQTRGGGGGGGHGTTPSNGSSSSQFINALVVGGGTGGGGTGSTSCALGGGGGGSGGGRIVIYANTLKNDGIIQARGGHGGAGWAFKHPTNATLQAAAGNGGGGSGGIILINYRNLLGIGLGFVDVSGGGYATTGTPLTVAYGWRGMSATGNSGSGTTGLKLMYQI